MLILELTPLFQIIDLSKNTYGMNLNHTTDQTTPATDPSGITVVITL